MPFSSADCAMVFCVERADVARIANKSAFLNIDGRVAFLFRIGKSESQVVLVFFAQGEGGFIYLIWGGLRQCYEIVTFVKLFLGDGDVQLSALHET